MARALLSLKWNTKSRIMKLALIVAGLGIAVAIQAQSISNTDGYERNENIRELGSTDGTGNVRTFDNRYEGVKGTPFVFEEWYPGEIFLSNKEKISIAHLNYNSFENEIVYKEDGSDVIRLVNKYKVDLFQLKKDGEIKTFIPVSLKNDAQAVFVEVLYDLDSRVYKVYKKEFLKANYEGGYSADRRHDEFIDKYDVMILKAGESTLYKVKSSKKYILSLFPENEKEISAYIKSNKPDLKEAEALVELMRYYDSL